MKFKVSDFLFNVSFTIYKRIKITYVLLLPSSTASLQG